MGNALVERQASLAKSFRVVNYLTGEEVRRLAEGCRQNRKGERDALLILVLFQAGLRISETLSLTPGKVRDINGLPAFEVLGKGRKPRLVACPERLAEKLRSYAYTQKIQPGDSFFPINRFRAWQILNKAGKEAAIGKPVYPHLLRHSDAIARLKKTGNPKALQHHLGHSSIAMTMRYLSTLTQEESLEIQQEVEFDE